MPIAERQLDRRGWGTVVAVMLLVAGGLVVFTAAVTADECNHRRLPSDVLGAFPQQADVLRNTSTSRDCDRYITITAKDGGVDHLERDLVAEMTQAGWALAKSDHGWCGTKRDGSDVFGVSLGSSDRYDAFVESPAAAALKIEIAVFDHALDLGGCP